MCWRCMCKRPQALICTQPALRLVLCTVRPRQPSALRCPGDGAILHFNPTQTLWSCAAQVINQWLWRLWHAASGAAASACGFLCGVCCTSERPLHFVRVDLAVPAGAPQQPVAQGPYKHGSCMHRLDRCTCHGLHPQKQYATDARPRAAGEAAQLGTPAGRAALQRALQAVLDHYRGRDIAAAAAAAAARRRRRRPVASGLGLPPAAEALLPSRAASHIGSDSGWFDAAPAEPAEAQPDFADDFSRTPPVPPPPAASAAPGAAEGGEAGAAEPAGAAWNGPAAGAAAGSLPRDAAGQQAAWPDVALEGPSGGPAAREGDAAGGPARPATDLARMGPLALALEEVLEDEGEGQGEGRVAALLAVSARRSTTGNSGGLSSVDGWPIRCGARRALGGRCGRDGRRTTYFARSSSCSHCVMRPDNTGQQSCVLFAAFASSCKRLTGQEQSSGACRRVK
jgi:hypothetical protein